MAYMTRLKPCSYPGCPYLTQKRFCPAHQKHEDKERPSAARRGYDSRWQAYSRAYLKAHPICKQCGAPSQCVDHIIAHKGDMALFWDKSNHQALCLRCNTAKGIREEGTLAKHVTKKEYVRRAYRLQ
jgi:5-methylcytosine-specific restriction protein A